MNTTRCVKQVPTVRIHYAVNCASIGCPALREEAFVAERLGAQLEEQAVRFLSDRTRNRVTNGQLEVSMIFKWFAEDWERGYTGIDGRAVAIKSREDYFSRYANVLADSTADRQKLGGGNFSDRLPWLRLVAERQKVKLAI